MDLNLTGKTAVVTGASTGIGLAIATTLAHEGMHVVVGSRKVTDELAALCDAHDVTAVAVDLAEPAGAGDLVAAAVEAHGGVDLLVNNVAVSEPAEGVTAFTDAQWHRVFDLTFFAAVRAVRAAVPVMLGRSGANIVNIGSLNARLPMATIAPYSAAKAALVNLGTALSEQLAPRGIRVNTVSPGPVRTPMWTAPGGFAEVFADQLDTTVADVLDRVLPATFAITTGRISDPAEVADLVAFLASDRAANITGADYVLDGGQLKTAV